MRRRALASVLVVAAGMMVACGGDDGGEGAREPDRTPLQPGVSQQALTVALEPGEYELVCDIHPNVTGTLTAD